MEFKNFLLGLLICFLLSFLLGIERQYRRRFIGLRTMILVSVGSYLFVSFSFLVTDFSVDVTRIAAQVVAGIGFLGAGVIIKDNKSNKITGLTTAATLWCDASLGMLCAGGFVKEAIVAALVVLFANIVLRYINVFVNDRVMERNIFETFAVIFVSTADGINRVRECVVEFIDKVDYMEMDSYKIDRGKLNIKITVRKVDLLKLDKFIHKIVTEYDIKSYEYKKMSEFKVEDNEEV